MKRPVVLAALVAASSAAALVAAASVAAADPPPRPLGSLRASGDLTLTGPSPRNRMAGDVIVYLGQRVGVFAGVQHVTLKPFADAGQVTAGMAYRAAAARPRLDLVLHADVGATWPLAPTAGGGVIAFFWPLKQVPVAVTSGTNVYLVLDGVDDTRLVLSVGLGLAIAR
jgi:hypothetical protein